VSLTACDGGGDAESTAWIRIDSPTDRLTTSADSIKVSGNAARHDGSFLPTDPISWHNSNGASGVASLSPFCLFGCISYWEADVPLSLGPNTITVTYIDGTDAVTITRTVSVSGRITIDGTGDSVPDIVVLAGPTSFGGTTDESGSYRIGGLVAGSYTITPQFPSPPLASSCLRFTPSDKVVAMDGTADIVGQDFIATQPSPCYGVTGRVTPSTNPTAGLADIRITITDAEGHSHIHVTDQSGDYSFHYLAPGTYTITPCPFGVCETFVPSSRSVTIIDTDVLSQDFLRQF
jgi:hypothetical protein